jgi:hypothetical protein
MKKNKLLIGITLLLCLSTIFFAYRSINLNNQLKQSTDVIDSITWSEFINLNNSLHRISNELMYYDHNLNEKELYLTLIGKESNRLNEIGMNLRRLLSQDNLIYEEQIWKIEIFINDISSGRLIDEEKIHQVAVVIDKQQNDLQNMFFPDNAIGVSGVNNVENIEQIKGILNIIIDEINEVN